MNKEILKNINVLYVEDETEVREFTSRTLTSIVKNLYVAKNGLEALEIFKENNNINLIVTDINMPKLGGLEMCREIRKFNNEIPIVITSAHSDATFLKEAIDVNVSSYALKPIDLYHLIESMIKAVEPIFLREKLEKVTKELNGKVEEAITQTKQILDAQDNIVFLTDLTTILHVNRKFLEFFNVSSYEEFLEKKLSIVSQFKEDKRFFSKEVIDTDSHWILQIQQLSESDRVVKMQNPKGEDRIFTVTIDDYENKNEHYIVCFTDITMLKEKASLLEYQASHDQLTGLFNRQKFDEILHKEIKRDKRYENELSLIIYSISNYKDFELSNKELFEEILKDSAQIFLESVREHDIIARWKVNEFLILLPQTAYNGAVHVMEKIDLSIQEYSQKLDKKLITKCSIVELKDRDDENSIVKRVQKRLKENY